MNQTLLHYTGMNQDKETLETWGSAEHVEMLP